MARKITTIPATINKFTAAPIASNVKRKVAGYARVSTDTDDQISSYAAQVDYYTKYIKERKDWDFVGIYTDEGVTGTSTKKREGFTRMIKDALAGKIQLIITKSVSRFARNTVDCLTTIRKLKAAGVECYFEKEGIWTLDSAGELLITVLSSISQEEARSISENTTWGQRKSFADGKARVPYKRFLGYDRGEDGNLVINPEQAKVVKLIYKLFLTGLSYSAIAKKLMEKGIKSPAGKDRWYSNTVQSILTSEKMKGDALLQKKFTVDFLTKKVKKNEGEVPQYYVTGNHEAIIPPATFDLVQAEIERRKNGRGKGGYSGATIFSNRIKCGECGHWYGSKVWHSNDKYRRVVYQCNNKFAGAKKCSTPHLTEKEIKEAFVKVVNKLLKGKTDMLENIRLVQKQICDTSDLEAESQRLMDEMNALSDRVQKCISENARIAQDQTDYQKRYDELVNRYETTKANYDKTEKSIKARHAKAERLGAFVKALATQGASVTEFDEGLWGTIVDFMTVYSKEDISVTFKDGTEIHIG
ncbi:recombinase family protein [Selenomonas ruminantium]|uniref:recombinase family protein n=1 Tax=Selenomonas ruminantium TaxID=971 RepID=UPI0004204B27